MISIGATIQVYSRIVSAYSQKIALPTDGEPQFEPCRQKIRDAFGLPSEEPIPFDAFLRYVAQTPDDERDWHWRTQQAILCQSIRYHFIGRMENYEADMAYALTRIYGNYKRFDITSMRNTTPRFCVVDANTWRYIYSIYRRDFEEYGYSRDSWRY